MDFNTHGGDFSSLIHSFVRLLYFAQIKGRALLPAALLIGETLQPKTSFVSGHIVEGKVTAMNLGKVYKKYSVCNQI